ncbi:MAG: hypothetical protein K2F90_05385 [Clostridiales bacterium]|nr:hypothetical protein [Clostridiales bacterium]
MDKHDYKDTINAAARAEDEAGQARAAKRDAEIAYEALAVSSSMGAYGQNEDLAELMQLQLTQEVLYKTKSEPDDND